MNRGNHIVFGLHPSGGRRSLAALAWPLLIVAAAASLASPALARTPPADGAVALPSGTHLLLPFPRGHRIAIGNGYGGVGHGGTDRPSNANDFYALDLYYADQPNRGLGMPVVAPLAGEVVGAEWATDGWAGYGLRVVLRHDLGDGHVYHTTYAHLGAIDPAITVGAHVDPGTQLGQLGRSCDGSLECPSILLAHVQFAMHRDSTFGGGGSGGSYGGNAVVPEPFDGAEDLLSGFTWTSGNGTECGDGTCEPGEDGRSCALDCGCAAISHEATTLEETSACFRRGGPEDVWHVEEAGSGGRLEWTTTRALGDSTAFGLWELSFERSGRYRLEAHTAAPFAEATAVYEVTHDGATDLHTLDQGAVDGWQTIDVLNFAAGGDQSVWLDTVAADSAAVGERIAFDGLRLTRLGDAVPVTAVDGGTPTTPPTTDRDGGSTSAGDAGMPPWAPPGEEPTSGGDDGGCAVTAPGARNQTSPWALALLVAGGIASVARRRRRVRECRTPGSGLRTEA